MSCLASLPDEVIKLVLQHVPLKDRLSSCCLVNTRLHAVAVAATQELCLGGWDSRFTDEKAAGFWPWLADFGQFLTRLDLSHFPQPLQQLPCPNLLELKLYGCVVQLGPAADGTPGVIHGCTKLTKLDLDSNIIDAPEGTVVDSLSCLVHLQHLEAEGMWDILRSYKFGGLSQATLPCLNQLTQLAFKGLSKENLGQLGGLTNLQELFLPALEDGSALGPSSVPGLVLPASITKLGVAGKAEASILSLVPVGLKSLTVNGSVVGPAEGRGSFLSYMARLQHLTHLQVFTSDWPPAGPAYSALTASSSLVSLCVDHLTLPAGVWPHVFTASCKLPHLTCLWFGDEMYSHYDVLPSSWGAADLSSLVSGCPNLQVIDMSVLHGPHVSELRKLTALTEFTVTYADGEMEALRESLKGLAAVTQLKDLCITQSRDDMTVAALLPLTSLTTLTNLECCFETVPHDDPDVFHLKARDGSAVWLQLLERCCAADASCQRKALGTLAQQLAEQKAMVVRQQQQIAHLQEQQERQLLAQQQVAAEQGARIAALEGQLQQLLKRHPS